MRPDAGDAVGDDDARQATAVTECAHPDTGDAVGDGDARQAVAVIECVIPNAGDAVGDGDARDFRAPVEGIVGYLQRILRDINTSDVIVKIIASRL